MIRRFAALAASALLLGLSVSPVISAEEKKEDPVVAVVNGSEIRLSEVTEAQTRLPAQYQQIPVQVVFPMLVNSLVDTRLMAGQARKIGLHREAEFKARLSGVENQLLERVLLARYIEEKLTDAKLKERYDTLIKEAEPRDEVRARHILLKTEEEAKKAIKDIKGGADFAKLATKRSTGPSATKGGDLGYFAEEQMVPAFSKAAFVLKKGAVTETPVKTQFGWHVIKVEDRRTTEPPSFESAKEEVRAAMSRELGTAYIAELRKAADIKRFDINGKPLEEKGEAPPVADKSSKEDDKTK